MTTRRILALALAALPLTIGVASAEPRLATVSGTATVIDGDTFSIRQHRVRIAAIDAREITQTGILNDGSGLVVW
ncbi:hypothetical protein [Brucella intermedia]|uniref:hypothetical protein n=1 Tax=Brucella intermedia TaxID=94625 RepID=UPI00124D6985|nr:hypothetical protein [Brucella intermedia]KAB2723382.1 hypothetical protein F9L02_22075 [Brucella intermedia]